MIVFALADALSGLMKMEGKGGEEKSRGGKGEAEGVLKLSGDV